MNALPVATLRRRISTIVFATVLVATALIFRRPLIAWFTGKTPAGHSGTPVSTSAGPFAIRAALEPDPPVTAGQKLDLQIRDASGKAIDDAKVEVVYDMPAMGSMPEMKGTAKVTHQDDGKYIAAFDLPSGGSWTLKTALRAALGSASVDFTLTVGTKGLSIASTGGTGGPAVSTSQAQLRNIDYPPIAFDALKTAMETVERIRADLARDAIGGVAMSAHGLVEALRAASGAIPNEHADTRDALARAATKAERLAGTKTVDDARKAFEAFNADFIPAIGADHRLTEGWRVFECSMFDGARWLQRSDAPENPYMGTKMLTCGTGSDFKGQAAAPSASGAASGEIDHYTCPMHPSVKAQSPGKCPICGMDLVPVTKRQQQQGEVIIDDARRQLIGVRTGPVISAPMRRSFRAVGQVAYDESKLTDVNLKVQGWIKKLYVNATGERVSAGQPLFSLYSPELYSAQQDFLLATQGGPSSRGTAPSGSRVEGLARAARQRLHLLGLSDGQIDAVSKKGVPLENITISSPANGFVIEKNVVDGAAVDPGMRLYRIAALNKVWVEAEVYEGDLPHAKLGQNALVTLDYLPGRSYEAKVSYVYPYLDPKSRTGKIRVELANKELDLRPGMYASVELASDAEPRVQVPVSAVVYTGPRRLVFVDLGQGRFRPQEVRVGTEADGMYEVLDGLKPGDIVATSGIFLIAAEARISTAATYWNDTAQMSAPSSSAMDHGAMPSGAGK